MGRWNGGDSNWSASAKLRGRLRRSSTWNGLRGTKRLVRVGAHFAHKRSRPPHVDVQHDSSTSKCMTPPKCTVA